MDEAIDDHALYDCHDFLLKHAQAFFDHLISRWRDLFNIEFDVLLYDITSTYFEIDPPLDEQSKRQFGYSRTVAARNMWRQPQRELPPSLASADQRT